MTSAGESSKPCLSARVAGPGLPRRARTGRRRGDAGRRDDAALRSRRPAGTAEAGAAAARRRPSTASRWCRGAAAPAGPGASRRAAAIWCIDTLAAGPRCSSTPRATWWSAAQAGVPDAPARRRRWPPHGQQLALDVPPGAANGGQALAHVGGVLASGSAGPRRLRYGTPRDLLIGITVVPAGRHRGQSPAARSSRTWPATTSASCSPGRPGRSGLITEAIFRLHPLPAATAFVTAELRRRGRGR